MIWLNPDIFYDFIQWMDTLDLEVRSNATAVERSGQVRSTFLICAAAIICVTARAFERIEPSDERTHTCGRTRTKTSNACGSRSNAVSRYLL
jgi:hypothetical protein